MNFGKTSSKKLGTLILVLFSSFLLITGCISDLKDNMPFGKRGSVMGYVKDESGKALPKAKVSLDTNYSTYTNDKGYYNFDDLKCKGYTLKATLGGYQSANKEISVSQGETKIDDIILIKDEEDNSESNSGITMSGYLGDTYSNTVNNRYVTLLNQKNVDQVWAFPLMYGSWGFIRPDFVKYRKSFPIEEDGSFEISLEELTDSDTYIFVLANSQAADKKEKIVDFLAIRGIDNLNSILVEDVDEDIDLGEVNQEAGEGVSTTTIDDLANSFGTYTSNQLKELAMSDNAIKTLINYYINYSPETGQHYSFNFSYSHLGDMDNIKNDFDPFIQSFYPKPQFYVRTNQGTDTKKILISPDGGKSIELGTSNDGNGYFSYFGSFSEEIPAGFWTLEEMANPGIPLAEFDFSLTVPFSADQLPVGYLPTIKLNVNQDDMVESVSIKWFLNTGAGDLIETTNLDMVSKIVLGSFIQYNGGDDAEYGGNFPIDINQSEFYFSEEIPYDKMTDIKINVSNIGYSFEIFWNK